MIPCNTCKHQYDKSNRCYYCKSVYWEFGKAVEYEPKTNPSEIDIKGEEKMIIIKMPMPKSCYLCPFTDNEYLTCSAPGKVEQSGEMVGTVKYKNHRHEDCPLMDFGEYMQDPVTKLLQKYEKDIKNG